MNKNETTQCACGCGQVFPKYDERGRERRFVYGHAVRIQPNKRQTVMCEYCSNPIERPQWHIKRVRHHFCNKYCEGAWSTANGRRRGKNNGHYNTIEAKCAGCGKSVFRAASLIVRRNNRVYCADCIPIKLRQGKRGFYVGYPKEFSPALRNRIRTRDNFTCRECGRHQNEVGTLHVHHIDYNKSNNDPGNLISLCVKCHGLTHFSLDYWKIKFQLLLS